MKYKIITIIFLVLGYTQVSAQTAEYATINGICYKLYGSRATVLHSENVDGYIGNVTIPEKVKYGYKNYDVDEIADSAFAHNKSLTSISLPYSTLISHSINGSHFKGCDSLTSIKVTGNSYYYTFDGVPYENHYNFDGSRSWYIFIYPPGRNGDYTIRSYSSSSDIKEHVRGASFQYCKGLTALNIPSTVSSIYGDFKGCDMLSAINVDEKNKEYCSENGIVYTKDKKRIVAFPPKKQLSFKIPSITNTISNGAFGFCNIDTLYVPNTITYIQERAFSSLETVLVLSGHYSNYQFLSSLHENSIVYAHGIDFDKIKRYWNGELRALEPFWVMNSISHLGSVEFQLSSDEITYPNATLKSIKVDNQEIVKKENSYIVSNLYPDSLYYIEMICELSNGERLQLVDSIKTKSPQFSVENTKRFQGKLVYHVNVESDESITPTEFGCYCIETKSFYKANEYGYASVDKLAPYTSYTIKPYAIYRNRTYFLGGANYSVKASTEYPDFTLKYSVTQTTITITHVGVDGDGTATPSAIGFKIEGETFNYDGKEQQVKELTPNKSYYIQLFANYNNNIIKESREIRTKGCLPQIAKKWQKPTSCYLIGRYDLGDSNLKEEFFTFNGEKYNGNTFNLTGLDPNKNYNIEYTVMTKEGSTETSTIAILTPAIELITLQSRCVSNTCAIVAAKTNIGEEETSVGFQWKKYDAPESLKPNEGFAAIYNGQLEGYIRNLQPTSYYNVRAFYKSAEGNYYYGDWVTFDPSDFSYFEPTVHTYEATEIGSSSAKVKGYVLAGTDDIIEQGFEYWTTGSAECKAIHVKATDENNVSTVFSTGQVMTATLTDLLPSSTYCFRSFVRTASGTTYGEEQTFTTDASTTGIGNVETDASSPVVVGYYDLSGRKHCEPQKGMNIVRYSDGSARKVFIK